MNRNDLSALFASRVSSLRRPFIGIMFGLALLLSLSSVQASAQITVLEGISTVVATGTLCSATTATCGDGALASAANLRGPYALVLDAAGNMYISDTGSNRIRKVDATTGIITTIAGTGGTCTAAAGATVCGDGSAATSATLNSPRGIVVDSVGNVYFADYTSQRVRKIDVATGIISTVAGTGTICATATAACGDGASATSANLRNPYSIAMDSAGNIYIADLSDNRIRKVTASTGIMSTVAGTGTACATTTAACGDGAAATSANLNSPTGVAVDAAGNIYIADNTDNRIRRVDATTGVISTIAGTGTAGDTGDGGLAASATLTTPAGVTVDAAGNVYAVENATSSNRIRKINPATGIITTVAGGSTSSCATTSVCGDGGAAVAAILGNPYSAAVDRFGYLYIPDRIDNRIRKVVPSTLFPATAIGSNATQNVILSLTSDVNITGITVPASLGSKQEYVVGTTTGCTVDSTGATASTSGSTCTIPVTFTPGYAGQRWAPLQVARLASGVSSTLKVGLAGTGSGPQVALTPGKITTVAGTGTACASATAACGDGAIATSGTLNSAHGVATDSAGNIYIADTANHRVRKIAAGTGFISTVAGTGTAGTSGDGAAAASAQLTSPVEVTVDAAGNLYIADQSHRIRKVDTTTGVISTFAGTTTACSSATAACGDGALATSANLSNPHGLAFDARGNLYIADYGDQRIRKVTAGTGFISTVAGSGTVCSSSTATCGDGATPLAANFSNPYGVAVDAIGNIYVADTGDHRIRKVDAVTGLISTIAGTGTACSSSTALCGDGAAAASANLSSPSAVTLDAAGNLYIADSSDQRVRKVSVATGVISTIAGTGTAGFAGDAAGATTANLSSLTALALDSTGSLYVSDSTNQRIRKVDVTSGVLTFVTPTTVGTEDTVDGTLSATLSNIGNQQLTLATPLTGTNPSVSASFGWKSASTCPQLSPTSPSTTLASGASCTLALNFTPAAQGSVAGSVVVTDDALNVSGATQSVSLNGTGLAVVAPGVATTTVVSLSSSSIAFGGSTNLVATVTPGSGTASATGTVSFTDTMGSTIITAGTATVVNGVATLGYTPTAAGTHVITASFASSDTNAFLSSGDVVGKTLTVTVATPALTVTPASIVYGRASVALSASVAYTASSAPSGAVTFTVNGGAAVTATCTGSSSPRTCTATYTTSSLAVGSYTISVSQAAAGNYGAATATAALTVTQATPTVTVPAVSINTGSSPNTLTATISYAGSAAPTGAVTFTLNGGSAVAGTCTGTATPLTCTASVITSTLAAGNYPITASLAADTNYIAATASGTLSVVAQDFSFSTTATTQSVTGGGSTSITFALAPAANSAYPGDVSFSVAGLPASASYTITPTAVTAAGGAQTVTLTIKTAVASLKGMPGLPWMRDMSVVLTAGLLPIFFGRRKRARITQRLIVMLVVLGGFTSMIGLSGCGSSTPKVKSTDYTVVVTATAGSVQRRAAVTLSVQ